MPTFNNVVDVTLDFAVLQLTCGMVFDKLGTILHVFYV